MIPTKLWNNDILYQSNELTNIYREELKSIGMLEYAKEFSGEKDGAIGGQNEEETNKHFSERFLTSSARVQFLVLDPKKYFKVISKDLKSTFLSGNITVLDIPCGTGAGILSLLCNLRELRNSSKLPRLPLSINILAGDYSSHALDIYSRLLDEVTKELEEELIFVTYNVKEWNAMDMKSTKQLIKEWLKDEDSYEEFYVLMSAFSGIGSSNYKKIEESFNFIQNMTCDLHCTTLLIEPNTNAGKSFLRSFKKTAKKWIAWVIGEEETTNNERFKWKDSITGNIAKSAILVSQYKRS